MKERLTSLRSLSDSVSVIPIYHRKNRDVRKYAGNWKIWPAIRKAQRAEGGGVQLL
jgi:hypothetical protein